MKKKKYMQPQCEVLTMNATGSLLSGSLTTKIFEGTVTNDDPQFAPSMPDLDDIILMGGTDDVLFD